MPTAFQSAVRRAIGKRVPKRTRYVKARPKTLSIIDNSANPTKGLYVPRSFPQYTRVWLTYCDSKELDASAGVPVYTLFSCNNVYDPDTSGTGHQPLGFDQYSGLYTTYKVIKSNIRVDWVCSGGSSSLSQTIVGSRITRTSNVLGLTTTQDGIREHPGNYQICSQEERASTMSYWNIKAVDRLDPQKMSALINTGPDQEEYYLLWASGLTASQDPSSVRAIVTIRYLVEFSEPKELAGS